MAELNSVAEPFQFFKGLTIFLKNDLVIIEQFIVGRRQDFRLKNALFGIKQDKRPRCNFEGVSHFGGNFHDPAGIGFSR